jgi:hypothetical protein
MVATDVASRGIGMIKTLPPYTATPSRLYSSALLSTLRRFLDCVICPGSFVSFGSLSQGVLDLRCSMFRATLVILYLKYFSRYKMWNWHLLT